MISLTKLNKVFGRRPAVEDLDLQVNEGEVFGLLGHNGAGKSTAIGMMLGQVWPTSGSIRICGFDITSERGKALQEVGAIFESPAFYDYLSGWRNLEILASYSAQVSPARLREVIDWVGLTGRESTKVRTYSHGMRARLALAQALLPQPRLLILDEPSDGLDPEGIREMRHTILRLNRELGLTILLSSHFLNEVEQLCSRIAVLNRGRKVYEGRLEEVRRREQWVKLRTGDFTTAVQLLTAEGLIGEHRQEGLVSLASGVGTDALVRTLVGRGIPVYEIFRHEETLEDFYMGLMNDQRTESSRSRETAAATPAHKHA